VAILLWENKKRKYANRRRLVPVDSMEQMEEDGGLDPPDDSAASTDEHLLKEDERRAVQKTVAGLAEKYRLPIQLFYAADMSVQEIADIMRIPEGTVKSRMSKARSLLKKELEALGYDR
jgi:RNA polymerase sigma-70 factor (ECF subfamily)